MKPGDLVSCTHKRAASFEGYPSGIKAKSIGVIIEVLSDSGVFLDKAKIVSVLFRHGNRPKYMLSSALRKLNV